MKTGNKLMKLSSFVAQNKKESSALGVGIARYLQLTIFSPFEDKCRVSRLGDSRSGLGALVKPDRKLTI